jgi:hypothetical protein
MDLSVAIPSAVASDCTVKAPPHQRRISLNIPHLATTLCAIPHIGTRAHFRIFHAEKLSF